MKNILDSTNSVSQKNAINWKVFNVEITENIKHKQLDIFGNNHLIYQIFSEENKIKEKIKNKGQIYTPNFIVKEMLDILGYNKPENILEKKIIDNSCGDGAFLIEIIERYINTFQNKFGLNKNNILKSHLEKNIFGIEIQEDEYINCINNLNSLLKKYNIENVRWNIILENTLKVKDYNNKMDYVVGNPPYVRVHNLDKEYDNVKSFQFSQNGMTDLYIVFYEIGLNMLNQNGKMCLITPNSFLNSLAGKGLREYIKKEKELSKIIDLEHVQVFENATTYNAITLFDKNHKKDSLEYFILNNKLKIEKVDTLSLKDIFIDDNIYLSKKDILQKIKEINNFNEINNKKSFDIEVKNGFATLADSIFINKDFNFKKYFIDILKASTGKWSKCFFPYQKDILVEDKDLQKEKDLYKYLLSHKSELEKRSLDKGTSWYGFGRSQGIKDINKNKIAINTIIKDINSIKLNNVKVGEGVYSGLYILTDIDFKKIEKIIKCEDFINYIKSLKKYKSGGYYNFSSSDLRKYLRWNIGKGK